MRNEIPILKLSNHTPKFDGVGIFVAASRFHGGVDSGPVWVHGVLVLPSDESSPDLVVDWLESLNITVISEANQLPQISPIVGKRIPILDHSFRAELANGTECRILPFSFNLLDCLGLQLFDDNFYVHVAARQYCSLPVHVMRSPDSTSGFMDELSGNNPQFQEVDQLIQAYDAASTGRFSDAVELFEAAMEDEDTRSDIDRPNLFNAAFCAGQAAIESEGELSDTFLAQSADWLTKDNTVKKSALENIQLLLPRETDPVEISRLKNKRFQLLEDMGLGNLSRNLKPAG